MKTRGKKKAAMESHEAQEGGGGGEAETITDIQNYLASFNKEIQDGGTGAAAGNSAAIETDADGQSTSKNVTATATTFYVTQSADGTAAVEGFHYDQGDGQYGTTYFASADGTYYAATDQGAQDTIAAYTAQGATVVPVATQQGFQTVATGEHSGLQQIVLAVSERSGAGNQSDGKGPDFVAIPATLTTQAGNVQGEQTALIAMQAASAGETHLDSSQEGQDHTDGSHVAPTHTIRMVLRQPDGTEIEQTIPISAARAPSIITGDGQELHVNDEGTLQVMATIAEQAAAGGLTDGNNQVLLNMANNYQTLHVVPGDGSQGEMNYMLIVQPADDDKDGGKELDLDMSVYDFNEGERPHGEVVSEEVAPDGTKTRTIRITQKKSQIVTQAHMCNYCNYTSPKRYLLSRHMKSHSEERPHKCGVCERGFKTLAALQNHVNTHTGTRPHCCRDCDSSFTTSGELVRHVRYRHTHEKPHKCTECDYASVELSKLKRHMRCHTGERPYQCPHCTYASPDMYKLKRHLRIHTGEKPYECDVCQARFTQSNSLKAHKLIHSGNKPAFHCEFCPTTCGRKTDLRIHMQKLHTSDKPLKCKRCGKTFPDRYSYKLHSKTHEGEKCFKCDLCPYASISQRHLESHMLIHTDQKPFRCDECDQAFRQKQLLRRHKNLYHDPNYVPPVPKEKTNECSECGKAFRHKGNLIRHLAIHDPEASENDKAEALRIGAPKAPGELRDGEEDDDDLDEDDDDLEGIERNFTGNVAFQEAVQEGQETDNQVVVFEVIQLHGQEARAAAVSEADGIAIANGEGGELTVLREVSDEQCYAGPDQVDQTILPEDDEVPNVDMTVQRRRGRPKRACVTEKQQRELMQDDCEDEIYDDPDILPVAKKSRVEDISDTLPVDNESHLIPDVSASNEASLDDSQDGIDRSIVESARESQDLAPEFAVREEELAKRRIQQKEKDMADCFGFDDDDEEAETILAMPTVPGVQSTSTGEGTSNHSVSISSLS